MADESALSADIARQVFSTTEHLTRRVRQAQRGTWFPLVLPHRARSRGVGARILPYVGAGVAVGLVFGVLSGWTQQLNLEGMSPSGPVAVGLVPLISISLALFVLAHVERSWAVLSFAIGYLVVTLLACGIGSRNLGLNIDANLSPTWGFLPALAVTSGVLLLGGAGFALAERRHA